jgi:hypothetical protein
MIVILLQVMGFEVDTINSVQLSNHTGYKTYRGQGLNEINLGKLFICNRYYIFEFIYINKLKLITF